MVRGLRFQEDEGIGGCWYGLFISIGALLSHIFINPPRKMGTYLMSHGVKILECCEVDVLSVYTCQAA